MKNLILVIGTVEKQAENIWKYGIDIFAEQAGENLQYLYSLNPDYSGYTQMTEAIKSIVSTYFGNEDFKDGAKTIYNFQIHTNNGTNHRLNPTQP